MRKRPGTVVWLLDASKSLIQREVPTPWQAKQKRLRRARNKAARAMRKRQRRP